jgi:hypothetical protein
MSKCFAAYYNNDLGIAFRKQISAGKKLRRHPSAIKRILSIPTILEGEVSFMPIKALLEGRDQPISSGIIININIICFF